MNLRTTIILLTVWMGLMTAASIAQGQAANSPESKPIGTRTGHFADIPDFPSKILSNRRNITVYLPPSYSDSPNKRYPVLYAHDGQNLFDTRTAFLNREWELDETVERMIKEGSLREIIIIGVWNTPDRIEEYTPGPSGDRYLRFLVEELKPAMDKRFSTLRDAKNTAIMGSSLGGLISTWAGLRYPKVFGQSASFSAVFQFKGEAITEWLNTHKPGKSRHYFDIGTNELPDRPERFVTQFREMEQQMERAGYRWGTDFVSYVDDGGQHNETFWAKRVWRPLSFLFGNAYHKNGIVGY